MALAETIRDEDLDRLIQQLLSGNPNNRCVCSLTITMCPSRLQITIASGADSMICQSLRWVSFRCVMSTSDWRANPRHPTTHPWESCRATICPRRRRPHHSNSHSAGSPASAV